MRNPRPARLDRRTFLLGAGAALALGCSGDDVRSTPEPGTTAPRDRPDAVPQPAGYVRTSWSNDPFALGAYSFLPVGAEPRDRASLAAPVDGRLFFAGEATDPDNPATVHGALASGRRAAAELASTAAPGEAVAVIGAGAAGAQAARLLHDGGFRVTVFEARDRIGGRLDTVQPDGWPLPVERGASWVHAVEDGAAGELADSLARLGVATAAFDDEASVLGADGARVEEGDRLDAEADTEAALEAALAWAAEQDGDRSVAEAVAASGAADDLDAAVLRHFYDAEIATEYGADPDEISAHWGFEEGSSGTDLLVTGGYGRLAAALLDGIDVRLATAVRQVGRGDDGVELRLGGTDPGGNGAERVDRVIVTVPLGVLQSGAIAFDPPLPPQHRRAIDTLGFGLLDKLWLRFDAPFWSDRSVMWTIVDDDGYAEWFNLEPSTGAPVLLALVGGQRARRLAGLRDDEAIDVALRSLQKLVDAGW